MFAGFALDEAGCELVIDEGDHHYRVAFERNAVIAASSPLVGDSALRVALTQGVITPAAMPMITKQLNTEPGRDIIEVVAEVAGLAADRALQLRRRVIAQAATRTFAIAHGTYSVSRQVTLKIHPHAGIDVRAVVYSGLHSHFSDDRLASDLARLGTRFVLRDDALDGLAQYGFTTAERPTLISLQAGSTLAELESGHPELGVRGVRALLYALVACRACDVTVPASVPAISRPTGTLPPPTARLTPSPTAQAASPRVSRPSTPAAAAAGVAARGSRATIAGPPGTASGAARSARPPTVAPTAPAAGAAPAPEAPVVSAKESYERGLAMLRDNVPGAIVELQRAASISKDPDHIAAMAWAVFCSTADKQSVAKATRQALTNAIFKSEKPELAQFFMGRLERMLGRDREALEQFKAVVDQNPRHAEALAEIRTLEARFAADGRSGLFQRKR